MVFASTRSRDAFIATLSPARIRPYVAAGGGDVDRAVELYLWNAQISQAFLFPLQAFEVALRNKLHGFFSAHYGPDWPTVRRFGHVLRFEQSKALQRAIANASGPGRRIGPKTDDVVVQLTMAFWNSMFTKHYDIHFGWTARSRLSHVFANDASLNVRKVYKLAERARILRNRIAHLEPVHAKPLQQRRAELDKLLRALCLGTHEYVDRGCSVAAMLRRRP